MIRPYGGIHDVGQSAQDGELVEVEGLKNRRKDEADLYFSK
jgi:hypothetical protein